MRRNRNSSASESGYTLLELLLVLMLIVGLFAISWPMLAKRLAHHDLQQAGMDLHQALTETRMRAMESGTPWACCLIQDSGSDSGIRIEWGPFERLLDSENIHAGRDLDSLHSSADFESLIEESAIDEFQSTQDVQSDVSHLILDPRFEFSPIDLDRQFSATTSSGLAADSYHDDSEAMFESTAFVETEFNETQWIVFDATGRTISKSFAVRDKLDSWHVVIELDGLTGQIEWRLEKVSKEEDLLPTFTGEPTND